MSCCRTAVVRRASDTRSCSFCLNRRRSFHSVGGGKSLHSEVSLKFPQLQRYACNMGSPRETTEEQPAFCEDVPAGCQDNSSSLLVPASLRMSVKFRTAPADASSRITSAQLMNNFRATFSLIVSICVQMEPATPSRTGTKCAVSSWQPGAGQTYADRQGCCATRGSSTFTTSRGAAARWLRAGLLRRPIMERRSSHP